MISLTGAFDNMSEVATATDDDFAGLSAKETINAMSDEKEEGSEKLVFLRLG